ncbi:MAG TPA: DNA methyltransferase [Candidatus Angelobacter sp.]|nr:DNA methyltransferase [Candidatus Angelobacter sp.]
MKAYYQEKGISLYHGDCRDVLHDIESESVEMALTDPPYLVSYKGRWGSKQGTIKGDAEASWIAPVFVELWRILVADALCFSFYGWPHADTFMTVWKLVGFRPISQIVCVKNVWGLDYFTRSQHETAYLLAKGKPAKPHTAISDVVDWQRVRAPLHPNQKPLATISKLMEAYTRPATCIVDPFVGSGTTLVAARNLGRRAIGIEVEERYCEIAARRLSQATAELSRDSWV